MKFSSYFLNIFIIIVFVLNLWMFHINASFFSLEELKAVTYEIDILNTPVKLEENNSPVLQMTSKFGQKYECQLPELIASDQSSDTKDSLYDNVADVKELLQPLQNSPCLLKTKDWWTYEFCFSHSVKQYHIEDGKIVGPVIILGLYESDYNWSNETNKEKNKSEQKRYHSQYYVNGSKCDLTGTSRTAEVRFFCEEDAGDYIYRVDEPGTCNYILTVYTARVCSHPYLKPLPSNKPHTISCSPLLTEQQFQEYAIKVEKQKQIAEEKRRQWLAEQQERLKKLKGWAQIQLQKSEENSEKAITDSEKVSNNNEISEDSQNLIDDQKTDQTDNADQSSKESMIKETEVKENSVDNKNAAQEISDQFNSIIAKTEEEMQDELSEESKNVAFSKLATTLNMLLEKLDKAEKDVAMATKELEKAKEEIVSRKPTTKAEDDWEDTSDIEESDVQTEEELNKDVTLVEKKDEVASVLDDGKVHVRIRRLGQMSRMQDGRLHELGQTEKEKLEQAVKEKLEKAGLDTGGRRIEVKIITAGYYDNEDGKDFHSLSDEETQQFQTMIMTLLTGNQEAVQEMERHKKMEQNYNFVWERYPEVDKDDDDD